MRVVMYFIYFLIFNTLGGKIGRTIGKRFKLKNQKINLFQNILIQIVMFVMIIGSVVVFKDSFWLLIVLCAEIFGFAFVDGMLISENSNY